jgi:integrase
MTDLLGLGLLRPVSKSGKLGETALGDWSVWSVVESCAKEIGVNDFGPHDLRRTCAKLCRKAGGEPSMIDGVYDYRGGHHVSHSEIWWRSWTADIQSGAWRSAEAALLRI